MLKTLKKYILLFIILLWLSGTNCFASTDVSWNVSWTWDIAGSPYVVTSSITLASGSTLTIDPGVIVKFNDGTSFTVQWNLQAIWNGGSNIVFTSIKDDSVGGDTNGDWGDSSAGAWDWRYIKFDNSWSNDSILDYIQLKYHWYGNYYWISFSYSDASISNSLVTLWLWDWIYSYYSNPSISNNTISFNSKHWIDTYSWIPIISNNSISNNSQSGIYALFWTPTIINNSISNNSDRGISSRDSNSSISGNSVFSNSLAVFSYDLEPFISSANNSISWNTNNSFYANNFSIDSSSWFLDNPYGDFVIDWWGTLLSWKTLNINEWNIFKMDNNNGYISIKWNLQAIGTSSDNIIFTSLDDNSVWQALWSWTPSPWDWYYFILDQSWSNDSILDYIQLKYHWYGNYYWISFSYSDASISNSLVTLWLWDWIYSYYSNPSISNTIIINNSKYWINCSSSSPTIKYNLLYQNTQWDQSGCTFWAWNLLSTDPQFITGTFILQGTSPAINAWDPALWNHPLTSNTYDIWVSEYTNLSVVSYTATVTNGEAKTLTYIWSFTQDPSSWNDAPVFTNGNWTITATSATISTNFIVKYIGSYTIKLVIKEWEAELLNKSSNFSVVN